MAAPYWVTDVGDLGTIQETEFYSLQLTGRDPEQGSNNTGLTFTLIAGKLPGGVALAYTGLIDGIPTQRSLLKGVPYEVSENITSTFVVRITDAQSLLADRTFSLTVAGPDAPIWSTAAGKLADVHDGQEITTTLAATDTDLHAIGDATIDTHQDAFGDNINCDSTSTMWTADNYTFARPYMVRATGSLGTLRHSNYYIELLQGKTLEDFNFISFEQSGNLPQGTAFNGTYETDATDKVGSCLVYGNVPSTTASSTLYSFKIRPKTVHNDNKYSPVKSITIYGEWIEYTLTVRGAADTEVTWS